MKIMVIYDSQTGNTEKMAKAIAEGAGSVAGVEVDIKKIGDPFPLSMLAKADAAIFGSPCVYAGVTDGMKVFLENMNSYAKAGLMDVKGNPAAVFGSYGWDGAWVMEVVLKSMVESLGYKVYDDICVETGSNVKYHADEYLGKCKEFGKVFAEANK